MYILVKLQDKFHGKVTSYTDMAFILFDQRVKNFTAICNCIAILGLCIAYFIFIGIFYKD